MFLSLSISLSSVLAQFTTNNYRIYSVKQSKEVSLNTIADEMENYDVLFFGEEHNDSVTHMLQKNIFELLYAKFGSHLALSMEMFDRDVQVVMNEYLEGYIREKNFIKDARAWNNYADYKPMVELAKANQLQVICANAPTRYTNLAGRKGQAALLALTKEAKKAIAPLPYAKASGKYYDKLMSLTEHTTTTATDTNQPKMPAMAMTQFDLITAQSLWDATMAYSIAQFLKKNKAKKVMQVNGKFHSDEGFAIVTQLKQYRPKAKSLIISSATDDDFPKVNWDNYKKDGDYIIITDPAVGRSF